MAAARHDTTTSVEPIEILEALGAPVACLSADRRYVFFNAAYREYIETLYQSTPVIGGTLSDALVNETDRERCERYLTRALAGELCVDEGWFGPDPGTARFLVKVFSPVTTTHGAEAVSLAILDETPRKLAEDALELQIEERKRREHELRTKSAALRTLSECGQAIVRTTDEPELLQQLCDIAVNEGGYLMAWIGYARQDSARTVEPAAFSGAEQGYLEDIRVSWADDEHGQGPTGRAIRTVSPVVVRDTDTDLSYAPWRDQALARGFRSSASLPIVSSDGARIGALCIYSEEVDAFDGERLELLSEMARDLSFGIESRRTQRLKTSAEDAVEDKNAKLGRMVHDVAGMLGRVVEARDPYTFGHQERVARLARLLAAKLDLPSDTIAAVDMAGLVHDVGKMHVPADILTKPVALDEAEWSLVKTHPVKSYEILAGVELPWPIAEIALQHHERLDGTGYPHGLADAEIMLEARILAVADVVEAMATHRPYRAALGLDPAIREIVANPGSFDPNVAHACLELFRSGELSFLQAE